MKKWFLKIVTSFMALSLVACSPANPVSDVDSGDNVDNISGAVDYHIGIVTGTTSQSEDEVRGAENFIEEYGSVDDGGMVKHVIYPDNFNQEQETVISQIVGLADDAKMKAIVVNQGIPGTSAAFAQIRELRPDILLLSGEAQEDPAVISQSADLVVTADNLNRGYLMILAAKKLGADTFVHASFPRHMSVEILSRRRTIMAEAAKDLGIRFIEETISDPLSDVGMAGAQQQMLERVPAWVEQYGTNTVFFTTNDGLTEPLIKRVAELGAMFVEADLPSPLMGYPGAFGIDLVNEAGDWEAILNKVEEVVVDNGGSGRMGTWAYSFNYTTTVALLDFAKRVIDGEADLKSTDDLFESYQKYTPGAKWNGSTYYDPVSDTNYENLILVYGDTYIFGQGYLNQTEEVIPDKYIKLR
jgi:hypothetical protein